MHVIVADANKPYNLDLVVFSILLFLLKMYFCNKDSTAILESISEAYAQSINADFSPENKSTLRFLEAVT